MNINYTKELLRSVREGDKLGLNPNPDFVNPYSEEEISEIKDFCLGDAYQYLMVKYNAQYWGDQCLNLTAQAFAILKHKGYVCEIVYGDVRIKGSKFEYGTTLTRLKKEYNKGVSNKGMKVHAWISIGDQLIIDFSLAARLYRHYDKNLNPYGSFIYSPEELVKQDLEHIPMLVGAQFTTKTCGIPL